MNTEKKKKGLQIFDQLSKQMLPSWFLFFHVCFFWIFMILGFTSSHVCRRQKYTRLHIEEKQTLNVLYPLTQQEAGLYCYTGQSQNKNNSMSLQ